MELKNKRVLLVGLGMLGGGEETAKFLVKNGAKLTVTDLRKRSVLEQVIGRLPKEIKFVFGEHVKSYFEDNEIIVFNQAIPVFSTWVNFAKELGKPVKSDITLFLENIKAEYIAITGTRGKTTVSTWVNYFLDKSVLGGNIPGSGLIKILNKKTNVFVLELSSFQLEYMVNGLKSPKVAIITNLQNDHLNRYGTLSGYLAEKAKIFLNQIDSDFLILNTDDEYVDSFLKIKPKAQIYYFSLKKLDKNGLFFDTDRIYFVENGKKQFICSVLGLEDFQKRNLLAALLGAYLYCRDWDKLVYKISSLPQVKFRQEVIFENKKVKIINDSAATSSDATIAAIERFRKDKKKLTLISGGTDKKLEFSQLADKINKYIKKEDLYLLEGSATNKLIKKLGYETRVFDSLDSILDSVKKEGVILFSPASASFEKFNNEVDRGNEFNRLIKKFII